MINLDDEGDGFGWSKQSLTGFVAADLVVATAKNMILSIEFFTNSPQYKNANIDNFVLALPLKINWFNF